MNTTPSPNAPRCVSLSLLVADVDAAVLVLVGVVAGALGDEDEDGFGETGAGLGAGLGAGADGATGAGPNGITSPGDVGHGTGSLPPSAHALRAASARYTRAPIPTRAPRARALGWPGFTD